MTAFVPEDIRGRPTRGTVCFTRKQQIQRATFNDINETPKTTSDKKPHG